ncbi:hypothetical protein H6G35_31785 [Aulosira sp. FACHB-113]|uniref:hypothetical protein n=1 Tax=Tolypothrix tenuis TaxID=457083 RepID=UPI001682F86C|nr:hypothetical protein [Aulosira sp. FACHB-113]
MSKKREEREIAEWLWWTTSKACISPTIASGCSCFYKKAIANAKAELLENYFPCHSAFLRYLPTKQCQRPGMLTVN